MPVTNYYTVNGRIMAEYDGTTQKDYIHDALGSVVGTVNSAGVVVNTYTYKPYGEQLAKTGVGADPKFGWVGSLGYRKTSRRFSEQYVRARQYGTLQGQWTTKDRIQEPPFVYGDGCPTTETDADGRQSQRPGGGRPIDWGDVFCNFTSVIRCLQYWIGQGRSKKEACRICRKNPLYRDYLPNCDNVANSPVPLPRWDDLSELDKGRWWAGHGSVLNFSSCPVRACSKSEKTGKIVCWDTLPFAGYATWSGDIDVVCDCDGTPRKIPDGSDWYVTDNDAWLERTLICQLSRRQDTTKDPGFLEQFREVCKEAQMLYGKCCKDPKKCPEAPWGRKPPERMPRR